MSGVYNNRSYKDQLILGYQKIIFIRQMNMLCHQLTFCCFYSSILTFKNYFLHNFSLDDNLRSKLVENNEKIKNTMEIFLFLLLLLLIFLYIVFQKIDIWDMYRKGSEKSISFHNLITWPICIQLVSNLTACVETTKNSVCLNTFSFSVNRISIHEKKDT